jgi:hypothetical protein
MVSRQYCSGVGQHDLGFTGAGPVEPHPTHLHASSAPCVDSHPEMSPASGRITRSDRPQVPAPGRPGWALLAEPGQAVSPCTRVVDLNGHHCPTGALGRPASIEEGGCPLLRACVQRVEVRALGGDRIAVVEDLLDVPEVEEVAAVLADGPVEDAGRRTAQIVR